MHFNPKNVLEQTAAIKKKPNFCLKVALCRLLGGEAALATFEVQGCSGGVRVHCSRLQQAVHCAAGECRIHFTHTHLTPPLQCREGTCSGYNSEK